MPIRDGMCVRNDLAGRRFGRLIARFFFGVDRNNHARWECLCDCGKTKIVYAKALLAGQSSCGCLSIERHRTQAYSRPREYRAYYHAKDRCTKPSNISYGRYGGRGIEFLFKSFEEFLADIGPIPESPVRLTLDRIDNNDHYRPGNVRWATYREQRLNQRPYRPAEKSLENLRVWREKLRKAKNG